MTFLLRRSCRTTPSSAGARTGASPRPALRHGVLAGLVFVAVLSGCGGGDDAAQPVVAAPVTPLPTVSTTVTGAVVKGPVAGAQVCGYNVSANARGAALGACTTTDANGTYSLSLPAGSGALWLEATGGSYTDEASSAAASLPAGAPLTTLVTANGASVAAMLTPLTTLALNTARANVGSSGTLDAAAFAAAASQVLTALNLPVTLDIGSTAPSFGTDINPYGTALTAISQMVANGSSLASILAATQPSALAAAYATAASPPSLPPSPPPAANGTPSASGTVTATGAAAGSITPQASGYTVTTTADTTEHRFFLGPVAVVNLPTATSTAEVKVTVTGNGSSATTSVSYADPRVARSAAFCNVFQSTTCGVTISTPAGATHPVTLTFTDTPLAGGGSLNGTLVGDAPGAAWSAADLPRSTDGSLSVSGTSVAVLSGSTSTTVIPGTTLLSMVLNLADGTRVLLNRSNSDPITVARSVSATLLQNCGSPCPVTLTESADGTAVAFVNAALSGGTTLNGSVFVGKTQGSLTNSGGLGDFTPVSDSVEAVNDARTINFSVLGTAAQAGISLFSVTVRAGRVTAASATIGIGMALYQCGDGLSVIGYPACSGITVAANGRSFSLRNATLAGGAVGATKANVAFSGSLGAKGL